MTSHEILQQGVSILLESPETATLENKTNILIAARLAWEVEEMGGVEHVQFAYRNNTPIVPPGACGHPTDLLARGYIDGVGWPKEKQEAKITLFRWPDGNHWYVSVDGKEVVENGRQKWNTAQQAEDAAKRFLRGNG